MELAADAKERMTGWFVAERQAQPVLFRRVFSRRQAG
jgi:hypothetical protein